MSPRREGVTEPAVELSAVIPTRGRRATLRRTLERLARQAGAPRFEVIVVEDAAEEENTPIAATFGDPRLDLRFERARVAGASGARNRGVEAARAAVVLFLDDDVLAEPRLIAEHAGWHQRHPGREVGVLGHVRWADELEVTPFMRWLDDGIQFDYPSIEGSEAGWGRFYTANASIKRELVIEAGGFDEVRFPFGYEDTELAYRMRALGFRLLYNPAARAEHLRSATLEEWERQVRRIAASERRFVEFHPEINPHFHERFAAAAEAPRASGRGVRLIGRLPRAFPLLGPRAWTSADMYFRQRLAPHFLEAWEEAGPER